MIEFSVKCTFKKIESELLGKLKTCVADQTIDSDYFVLETAIDTSIEQFFVKDNSEVKFLPERIGEKFPNLKVLSVSKCALTILREHYFKNMTKLKNLLLNHNQIEMIELDAFKDLKNVETLWLRNNKIEKFNGTLFSRMNSLITLLLSDNQIKFLSSTTITLGQKLEIVDLERNNCINKKYLKKNLQSLVPDLKAKCSPGKNDVF